MAQKMNMRGNSEKEGKAWGRGEFANMPKEEKMQQYPKANQYGPSDLDDTMSGIDQANAKAASKSHKFVSNQH